MIAANKLGYVTFEEGEWRPASGHRKGWRVVKEQAEAPTIREHSSVSGRLILYKSYWSAQAKAVRMNLVEGSPMRGLEVAS